MRWDKVNMKITWNEMNSYEFSRKLPKRQTNKNCITLSLMIAIKIKSQRLQKLMKGTPLDGRSPSKWSNYPCIPLLINPLSLASSGWVCPISFPFYFICGKISFPISHETRGKSALPKSHCESPGSGPAWKEWWSGRMPRKLHKIWGTNVNVSTSELFKNKMKKNK